MEFIYMKINLVVSGQKWFRENNGEKEFIGLWTNVMLKWLRVCKKSIILILIKEFMKSKDF